MTSRGYSASHVVERGVRRRLRAVGVSAALALLASACTSTYRRDVVEQPATQLSRGEKIAIATPKNGFYSDKEYRASGADTAQAVRASLSRISSQAELTDCADLACLRARVSDAKYYVVPEILHWEDRNTEWSGKSDKVEIKISIYDDKAARPLASGVVKGKSKWMTFGGDHPQDLLAAPIQAYVDSIF